MEWVAGSLYRHELANYKAGRVPAGRQLFGLALALQYLAGFPADHILSDSEEREFVRLLARRQRRGEPLPLIAV